MLERFLTHLKETQLILHGSSVLVGYSGGPDSTCLLHLLSRCAELKLTLTAAHLNHSQRAEADEEQQKCESFAESLNIPIVSGRAEVPLIAKTRKLSIEEAGRHARYQFFDQAQRATGSDWIATGHTLDDHVETVLFHLTRGSGISGLAGIPTQRGSIIRPLLPFTRSETRMYCHEHGLWFHDDPANTDTHHARTIIREKVVPPLKSINPNFFGQVERFASLAVQEDVFLDQMAAAILERAEQPLNGDLAWLTKDREAAFSTRTLRDAPQVLGRRAIRLAAKFVGGTLDWNQCETVWAGLTSGAKGSITCEGGQVQLVWTDERLAAEPVHPETVSRYPLGLDGTTDSPVFGWSILSSHEEGPKESLFDVTVDLGKLRQPLHVRGIEPGDAIQPTGMDGHRKIGDVLQQFKLTHLARATLPLVCDLAGPVWLPGCILAARVQPDESTKRPTRLRFLPYLP